MAAIIILCPVTGREVDAGIEMDSDTLRRIPDFVSRLRCPHCGRTHAWSRADARVRRPDGSLAPWPGPA